MVYTQIKGFIKIKNETKCMFQCPSCNTLYESISVNENNEKLCCKCKKTFHKDLWKIVEKKIPVCTCNACGNEIILLTKDTINNIHFCPYPNCNNFLAANYQNKILPLEAVLDLNWNKKLKDKSIKINNNLSFAICNNKKDLIVLQTLQFIAKNESSDFYFFKNNEQKAALIFNINLNKYIGYLIWTEDKNIIMQQSFIVRSERRKNYATKMKEFWIKNIANNTKGTIAFFKPNEISYRIIKKLEHLLPEDYYII
jgi:hypothetical protein